MNIVIEIGRLTNKPELRYTTSNIATTRFTLAVKKNVPNKEGDYGTDFIGCVAYNKTAELISKYLDKGRQIAIRGHIETGSYDGTDGKKVYTTDIVVDETRFLDTKKKEENKEVSDTEIVQKAMSDDPFKEFGQQIQIENEGLPF